MFCSKIPRLSLPLTLPLRLFRSPTSDNLSPGPDGLQRVTVMTTECVKRLFAFIHLCLGVISALLP